MNDLNFGVNIVPTIDEGFSLGNSERKWNGAYISNLNASYISSGTLPNSVIPTATSTNLGGIKISNSTGSSSQTYKVALDSSNYAYVGVPWTDQNVTMTNVTTGGYYPLLFKSDTSSTDNTAGVFFNQGDLRYGPGDKILDATNVTAKFKHIISTVTTALMSDVATKLDINSNQKGIAYFNNTAGDIVSTSSPPSGSYSVLTYPSAGAPEWNQITSAYLAHTCVTNDHLVNKTISIGTATAILGSTFNIPDVVEQLGLNKALTYRGVVSSLPANSRNGDVYVLTLADHDYAPGVYAYNDTTNRWDSLGTNVAYKITQEPYNLGSNDPLGGSTITTFIKSISQDGNGNITATTATIPAATTANLGLIQIGSGLSINNGEASITTTTVVPQNLGATAEVGTSDAFSRSDHIHQLSHLTITVPVTQSTVTAANQYWYFDTNQYYYDIPHTFVTTGNLINGVRDGLPTDVNASIIEGYTNLVSKLTISTDVSGIIRLKSDKIPAGSFTLKLSLDKTLT